MSQRYVYLLNTQLAWFLYYNILPVNSLVVDMMFKPVAIMLSGSCCWSAAMRGVV